MSTKIGFVLLVLCYSALMANAHTWMTCPTPFNNGPTEGANTNAPCQPMGWKYETPVNHVKAGDRFKIGWIPNNHRTGYTRVSLVPMGQETVANFQNNVIKYACFGDSPASGDPGVSPQSCTHPCNARAGCMFQNTATDVYRYDTTITIPTNLADGYYTLQSVIYWQGEWYSCARLYITGGNPSLTCNNGAALVDPQCKSTTKPSDGGVKGNFCYFGDHAGGVDDRIAEIPVNAHCDPRLGCGNSANPTYCASVIGAHSSDEWWPYLDTCPGLTVPGTYQVTTSLKSGGTGALVYGNINNSPTPQEPTQMPTQHTSPQASQHMTQHTSQHASQHMSQHKTATQLPENSQQTSQATSKATSKASSKAMSKVKSSSNASLFTVAYSALLAVVFVVALLC